MRNDRRGADRGRRLKGAALAIPLALLAAFPVRAGNVSASLTVSVVVPPRVVFSVESEPASLRITDEDVARGFVDVPAGTRIRVRTNDPAGWLLEFQVASGPFRSIEVTGLGAPAQIGATGGWLAQAYAGRTVVADLMYRFVLSADARAGTHPWPLALSARPR